MFRSQFLRTGTTVLGPWFPRGGDSLRFTVDVVAISGATLKVSVLTKNSEERGEGSPASATSDIEASVVGRETGVIDSSGSGNQTTGFKELTRYKFQVSGDLGSVLFRMLPEVWFNSVDDT